MTVFSTTLTIAGSFISPTIVTQNITSSDSISAIIETVNFAYIDWFLLSTSGCTVDLFYGLKGETVTITPTSGATSYFADFESSRETKNGTIFIYGRIEGTISAGADTTPDAFTFTDQTNVALNSTRTSNTITVSGITAAADISVFGGTYSINGGAYTSSSGTVTNGQTVSVRHTSSSSFSTGTSTFLTIGGVSDTFSSTTLAADATPDGFTFTDQSNVALNSTITSNTITVSGINTGASISITGGSYSISGGGYTTATGTITNGQTVTVQHTSSSSFSTGVNTVLTIGGVSDTFTSTTLAADTTPNAFAFTDQTNVALNSTITSGAITVSGINTGTSISITGGTYSIAGGAYTSAAGTVTNGQTVTVRHTSSASNSTAVNTTLTIGGVSDTFTSTTAAAVDTTPDAFTFTDQTGVPLSSVRTSNTITVTGIAAPASISITGGTYSIAGGAYTSATGSVSNGQTVTVQHTSSASNSTAVNTTLTIGGVSDTFTSTTLADTIPDAFTFTDQTGVALNSTRTSNTITVSGITAGSAISITGGTYSIGGGAYTSASGTVTNGQTVSVQHTSSGSFSTAVNTTLTIGGVSDTFTSTTLAADATPDAFTFTDQTGVALNTTITSNTITISGINTGASISITGGSYSISGGAYTSATGTITNGQTVTVQHTSSGSFGTGVNTTLTIGGVSDTFTSTTLAADTTPNAFTFTDQSGVAINSTITSNAITVSGINTGAAISITGGTYSIAGGAYTSATGTVTNGQTVTVRHTSSSSFSTAVNTTLTIGGISDTFTSTTGAMDTTPNAFSFTDQTNVAINSLITSDGITVSGINSPASISITGVGTYSIDGATYTNIGGTVANGQVVTVRHTSSASYSSSVSTILNIGGVSDTFTSTTGAAGSDSVPNTFGFADQINVPFSSVITSDIITVSGINTATSISVFGGTYSINGGAYTSVTGTVTNGQTVSVRHTSSGTPGGLVSTTLTIGGVSDTFTSTTTPTSSLNGLRVWDSSGVRVVDTSTRIAKVLGFVTVTTPALTVTSGSVTDSGFTQGTPFYFIVVNSGYTRPTISFSGSVMNYSLSGGFTGTYGVTIYYGVY
jgi:hypothetical protein